MTEVATGFKGQELWTITAKARDMFKLHWIYGASVASLDFSDSSIDAGSNSGYQVLGLARLFGAKKAILLGYDFQRTGGRVHWHPDHPRKLGNGGRFDQWGREMAALSEKLKRHGQMEVVNCSRVSALTCFRRSTVQEELA